MVYEAWWNRVICTPKCNISQYRNTRGNRTLSRGASIGPAINPARASRTLSENSGQVNVGYRSGRVVRVCAHDGISRGKNSCVRGVKLVAFICIQQRFIFLLFFFIPAL